MIPSSTKHFPNASNIEHAVLARRQDGMFGSGRPKVQPTNPSPSIGLHFGARLELHLTAFIQL
jgi:hypothetical protein